MSNELTLVSNQLAIETQNLDLVSIRMDDKRYPRIHQFSREQLTYGLMKIVGMAFMLKGVTAENDALQFIATELANALLEDNEGIGTRVLTFPEISRAVRRGVLTKEMYGISVASLYKILTDYVKGEGCRASERAEQNKRKALREAFEKSPASVMISAYAGEMLNNK